MFQKPTRIDSNRVCDPLSIRTGCSQEVYTSLATLGLLGKLQAKRLLTDQCSHIGTIVMPVASLDHQAMSWAP